MLVSRVPSSSKNRIETEVEGTFLNSATPTADRPAEETRNLLPTNKKRTANAQLAITRGQEV